MFYVDSTENDAGGVSEVDCTDGVQRTIVEYFVAQSYALQAEQSHFYGLKSHKTHSIFVNFLFLPLFIGNYG